MNDHIALMTYNEGFLEDAAYEIDDKVRPLMSNNRGPEGDIYSAFFYPNEDFTSSDFQQLSEVLHDLLSRGLVFAVGVTFGGQNITAEVLGLIH